MVLIFLLVVGICLLLLIVLTLYFIPVIGKIALGKTPESGYVLLQASWGLIGARTRMEGGESRQEFLIGERPLYTRTVKDRGSRKYHLSISKVLHLLELIPSLTHLLGKLLNTMTFQELRGNLMVGFKNPAATGIFYGWYFAILPALIGSRVSLDVTPVFNRQVLEGEVMTKVRVDRPLLLILTMAKLYRDRDVRNALSGLRED
jgi:hypothetical protein